MRNILTFILIFLPTSVFAFSFDGDWYGTNPCAYFDKSQDVKLVIKDGKAKVDWGDEYTGAYQYTTSRERSWIHCDNTTRWAGVCYLTPNAPLSAGTGLFKHKETGLVSHPLKDDGSYDKELMDEFLEITKLNSKDVRLIKSYTIKNSLPETIKNIKPINNMYFIGDWSEEASIDGAIKSGRLLAENLN